MTSTFNTTKTRQSPLTIPIQHWSDTFHETILLSNDTNRSIQLPLAGGADNGQFIYFNDSISILKNKTSTNIIKGGKIDLEEIILEIDQHRIAGCTLTDVQYLIETLSANGKQIKLKTVKNGMFVFQMFSIKELTYNARREIKDHFIKFIYPQTALVV
jgi:hypothetical protein